MSKSLVIVESPTKARTLEKFLGKDFHIEASLGHVKDLPRSRIGVNVENGFRPEYEVLGGKSRFIEKIRKLAKSCDQVYLAPDPDREGEAIAWHIAEELRMPDRQVHRATFEEITRDAVVRAIEHPGQLNRALYEAQQARRILDRLVGYKISPMLWTRVQRGLSAGRVQSVALRLICDREDEIRRFVAREWWSVDIEVEAAAPPPFPMKLAAVDGKKIEIATGDEAQRIVAEVTGKPLTVAKVEKKEVKRMPAPPFITSTLQQEAYRKLRFSVKKTMMLAQQLYEGVDLKERGVQGLITYMRTDSVRLSKEAVTQARAYIAKRYGKEYVPARPHAFKSRKSAQEAHEAIRPASLELTPEVIRPYVERDQYVLYELIWKRFIASQMEAARFNQTRVTALVDDKYGFTATGLETVFPGFLAQYESSTEERSDKEKEGAGEEEEPVGQLPPLEVGDRLALKTITPNQHFTEPPPRYNESSLVRELERQGIGRPSTYASIVSTIQEKNYVERVKGRLHPTELGETITDLLVDSFPEIMDVKFTALLEEQLDRVEDGSVDWVNLLENFWRAFKKRLDEAGTRMRNLRREIVTTEVKCDKCGAPMLLRWGRNGRFLACSAYPRCRNAKPYVAEGEQAETNLFQRPVKKNAFKCDKCGREMVIKTGRRGRFLACSGYPECRNTMPLKLGLPCPQEGCDGELVERMSKRGRVFYSCTRYPECRYVQWEKPVKHPCPACGYYFVVLLRREGRQVLRCPKCKHTEDVGALLVGKKADAEEELE
jgi:DNA topoisomerase-1